MRIGIITDIHENAEKLERALQAASLLKCDELVCLGDIVGYDIRFYRFGPKRSAKRCVELVRSNCRWIVAGNHDLFAAMRLPRYSDGFSFPEDWFSINPADRKKISSGKVWCYEGDLKGDMGDEDVGFLSDLPESVITSDPGVSCLFSHYIYPDFTGSTTRYVERNSQLKGLWKFMEDNKVCFSFSGHSHTTHTGFAYKGNGNWVRAYLKAFHSIPSERFYLGGDPVIVMLPPLTGEDGKTGFTVFDTGLMELNIVPLR